MTDHPDPMAADRRVLVVALVAMVVFVSVGVVSAQLFAGSPCGDLAPSPSPVTPIEVPFEASRFEAVLGPASGAWDVGFAADGLVEVFDGRLAVTGPGMLTTGADGPAGGVLAAPARVVGGGDTLWSIAWMNDLTGQVDALVAIDEDLEVGTCVDTAVVGSPFAFHLDAGDGQLLLLRVEEDARDPLLQLRDPVQGSVWEAPLVVPVAPPGILAERVTGRVGPDTVVTARRVLDGESEPAIATHDRTDGALRWNLDIDEAGVHPPAWLRVLHVGASTTVLEEALDTPEGGGSVFSVSLADGSVTWRLPVDPGVTVDAVIVADGDTHVATSGPAGARVTIVGPDGSPGPAHTLPGSAPVLVDLADLGVLAGTREASVLLDGAATTIDAGGVVAGRVHGGDVWLVLRLDGGDVLVGFDRP